MQKKQRINPSRFTSVFSIFALTLIIVTGVTQPVEARKKGGCDQNLPPVSIVTPEELTLTLGERFELSGSESYDPEGSNLQYYWKARGLRTRKYKDTLTGVANRVGDFTVSLTVRDECGVRDTSNTRVIVQKETPVVGSLTVAEHPASPQDDQLITGSTSQQTVAELNFVASGEAIDLKDISFNTPAVNGGTLNDEFTRVYLFDGTTEIASQVPAFGDSITFTNLDGKFIIPVSAEGKRLTVKVDTAFVSKLTASMTSADSGQGVRFLLAEDAYSAQGIESGVVLDREHKHGTFTGKEFTVHKSIPVFQKTSLASNTLFDGSGIPFLKFILLADPKGDVGFYKTSFGLTIDGVIVTSYEFFEEPGTANEVNLTNDAARIATNVSGNEWELDILYDVASDGQGDIRVIPAGTSKTFELRASVQNASAGDVVATYLLGDGSRTAVYPDTAAQVNNDSENNFIWSDLHYGPAHSGSVNNQEWFNGYLVPGLSEVSTAEYLVR